MFVPNSSKPPSKKAVVEWFRAKEIPRRAGFEKDKNAIATWFHGILALILNNNKYVILTLWYTSKSI